MNKMIRLTLPCVIVLLVLATPHTGEAAVNSLCFVDASATGGNTGGSWEDAYTDLQSAIGPASPCTEVWVAAGTYQPTSGTDRTVSFALKNDVAIYGGFAGTETELSQRDWSANLTTLSGDIGVTGVIADNVYHVVTGSSVTNTAVLDGFTISGGNANGSDLNSYGGGMYNHSGSPSLANVTFSGNTATYGGGISNSNHSSPILTDVTFSGNSAGDGGGMHNVNFSSPALTNITFSDNSAFVGGGMCNDQSSPVLTDVTFSGNSADVFGGGMFNYPHSSPTLTNVTFSGNSADWFGGGMHNDAESSPTLTNVTFSGNSASIGGGGMFNNDYSSPILTNVTFSGNFAADSGGGISNGNSSPTLTNVILWGNTAPDDAGIHNIGSTPQISYSDIQGCGGSGAWNSACGTDGGGNIEADPLYLNPANGNLRLQLNSPAIDAGNNVALPPDILTDLDGNPRFVDIPAVPDTGSGTPPIVDMGAYEAQSILYAAPTAQGSGNCSSWEHACTLQTALTSALSGDEIWVMQGVHYPGTSRTAAFALKNNVAVYGGFAGTETFRDQRNPPSHITVLSGDIDQNDLTDPNGIVTDTVNIQGENVYHVSSSSSVTETAVLDGFTITAGQANGGYAYSNGGGMYNLNSNPSLTNVTFSGNSAGDGGGMYNNYSNPSLTNVTFSGNGAEYGGGMFNYQSIPTLTNVTFSGNSAGAAGGGMYNNDHSSPTLTNVNFSGNFAYAGGGGMFNYQSSPTLTDVTFSGNGADFGGGMGNGYSSATLTNVTFSGNTATYGGGGMENGRSNLTLTNVTFSNNSANIGGGMCNDQSSPMLTNVTFSGNSAGAAGGGIYNQGGDTSMLTNVTFSGNTATYGGGMYNYYSSSPSLLNVTFSGNTATYGGGMYNYYSSSPSLVNVIFSGNIASQRGGGMDNRQNSSPSLANCILWGNTVGGNPSQIEGDATVTYSDIQGGWTGEGNIDLDPLLGPLQDNGGSTLTHALLYGSPAIDAGDNSACPATDQRGVPRPLDGDGDGNPVCDMGAYEFDAGIHLSPVQQSASAAPGSTLEYTLTLYNFTPLTDTYSLALGTHAWETSLSASQLGPLDPGETASFTASVTIPAGTNWYNTEAVSITATSTISPSDYLATASIATQAYAPPQISLSPLFLSSTQYVNEIVTQTLTISNGYGVTLTFVISNQAAWVSTNPFIGEVETSSALPVQVSMDSTSLAPGIYTTTLSIATNDPLNPLVQVPVIMTVLLAAPTSVTLTGPDSGLMDVLFTFTATVEPVSTTLPLTYLWQADGQATITHTSGLEDTATFVWSAPGIYAITVSAANDFGEVTDTHTITITEIPIAGLAAVNDGPTILGTPTTFTATITTGTNVTFTWNFGDGMHGSGAVAAHTYAASGVYTATVTATNSLGPVSATTVVQVTPPLMRYYLPWVQREPQPPQGDGGEGLFGWGMVVAVCGVVGWKGRWMRR